MGSQGSGLLLMVQGVVRTRQGPMDETWANDKVEHNTERGPEEVAAE
jgi:hypothetical protein